MTSSKTCFKCNAEKPLSEFYKHSGMADGHLNKCKSCTKSDVGAHREANIDRIRAYDRDRAKLPSRAVAAAAVSSEWRRQDSRRSKCHNAVARALRNGMLKHRPCEWPECKSENSVAHHESYDRPLDVVFYCQPHHKKRHAEMEKKGIEP